MPPNNPQSAEKASDFVRYLTDRDVAAWYSCSRATVWRKARLGQIPKPVHLHGITRWDVRDLEAHSAAVRGN